MNRKILIKILIITIILIIGWLAYSYLFGCGNYSNYLKAKLDELNLANPCNTVLDCEEITYYPCQPYCIHKDVDLLYFYSTLGRKRPRLCPQVLCSMTHKCVCENSTCLVQKEEDLALLIEDEIAACLKKYPAVEFKDCIPGEVVDGWKEITVYPNTLDTSSLEHFSMLAPDIVTEAAIAHYGNSRSTCQNTWSIKADGEWKEVSQIEFCNHITNHNTSCDGCLLEWEADCC